MTPTHSPVRSGVWLNPGNVKRKKKNRNTDFFIQEALVAGYHTMQAAMEKIQHSSAKKNIKRKVLKALAI
jgi:hypothetical protein